MLTNSERNESVCDYGEMLGKELADLVIKHIETIQLVKSYELIDYDEANEHDASRNQFFRFNFRI